MRLARGPYSSPPCPAQATTGNASLRAVVDLAEAVLQEHVERDILLANESALRQLFAGQQIEHSAHRRRGRGLYGAQNAALDFTAVDFVGVGLLDQLTIDAAADRDEDDHDV